MHCQQYYNLIKLLNISQNAGWVFFVTSSTELYALILQSPGDGKCNYKKPKQASR